MPTLFTEFPYTEVIAGLGRIGYTGRLLEENYKFTDYFHAQRQERHIEAAAFGQTPTSYESACIGIAVANGLQRQDLVNNLRALGAPIILEIDNTEVREWAVSRTANNHALVSRFEIERIGQMIESRASDWIPQNLLRDKNIGSFSYAPQLGLFAGLLPELEEHIQEQLEPLLHDALSNTKLAYLESTGRNADPDRLFKLIFWILTAKVFHDRKVQGFISLGSDPEEIISAVAKRYDEDVPRLLLNQTARRVAVDHIWTKLDFRNLSVEVLAQMWSTMLIDDEVRERLSIHRTSRTIVRYIVERIPFEAVGDESLSVLEPCSGSAGFLIGAMNILRPRLFGAPPQERHKYFTKHLEAIEADPFGVEISRLALTLADFPHPGGWNIEQGDVFEPDVMVEPLMRAGVVLCNPPFAEFTPFERETYKNLRSTHKPVELLHRVLDDLHPRGVLGFVLPRIFVDGGGSYREIRKRLADRFATIEVNVLPDRFFDADAEIALLIATEPIPHDACRIISRKVEDTAEDARRFTLRHEVTTDYTVRRGIHEAAKTFAVPHLPELWDFLASYPTLGSVAETHRGIEWNVPLVENGVETGNRNRLVRSTPAKGFKLGVAPQTRLNLFETPKLHYLSVKPEDQRGSAYEYPWDKPKALVNGSARSRRPWRLGAVPDSDGLVCYQNHIGVWPRPDSYYDEFLLSAVLNAPVANAFIATREGKLNVTQEILRLIPIPRFTDSQKEAVRLLIDEYRALPSERLLLEIDALVLKAYHLHPRLETELLKYFQDQGSFRRSSFAFGNYFPSDFDVYFSLAEYLSPRFQDATAGELRKRMELT